MTSEFNRKLPIIAPQKPVGIKRRPNRRDLIERNITHELPDLSPSAALQRAALRLEQVSLISFQQIITDMNPESSLRSSLTVIADPREDSESNSDWETLPPSPSLLDSEEENWIEDKFIGKMSGVNVWKVKDARVAKRNKTDMQGFVKKVRDVKRRRPKLTVAAKKSGRVSPPLPSPCLAAAAADLLSAQAQAPAPNHPPIEPGTTLEMTAAQAALALTNSQAGTNVTMDDLRTVRETEDDEDTYFWDVGSIDTRELTAAQAALILTNVEAGTDVTMQDLRTAREMVDLWDCEDTFQWTVGNIP